MRLTPLCFLFALIVSATLLTGCAPQAPGFEEKDIIRPAMVQQVGQALSTGVRTFSGITQATQDVKLSFRVGGQLQNLPIKVGQRIRQGQIIARVDPIDFDLEVKQQEATLANAMAQFQQAKSEYDRQLLLYESNNASKSDLDQTQASYLSAKAQLEANKKALQLNNQQRAYTVLRAKSSGVITTVEVDDYEMITAGQTIATMADSTSSKVALGVPATVVNRISQGDIAQVLIEDLGDAPMPGRITEIGIQPDGSSTYPVTIKLNKPNPYVRPGMVADITLPLKKSVEEQSTLFVPSQAVQGLSGNRHQVWIMNPKTNIVSPRNVSVGVMTSEGLQILSGLQPGETIVVRGIHRLKPEQQINPQLLKQSSTGKTNPR
ncbi:MAG: efflux RND transporter periplasmic adaptor subunit [Vampirovibrio sp.]|nr:efflux RND transporter periplasmic adaptor subunit [Vampirovibrio sp.]